MTQTNTLATGNQNNQIAVMSMETAKEKAPGIFAPGPHSRLSKNYKFISSLELIDHLDKQGWGLVNAKQSTSKKKSRPTRTPSTSSPAKVAAPSATP